MSDDIVDRLLSSVNAARATDRSELLREAAAEIKALRRVIHGRDEAMMTAIRLMTDSSYRAGWTEGGMLAILHGHADPLSVARTCLDRFEEPGGSTQKTCVKPRRRSKK